jgi:hypothetical protein
MRRRFIGHGTLLLLAWLCVCLKAFCQTQPFPNLKIPIPESGYLSSHQYTNAFFGFTLPLPGGGHFQPIDTSDDDKALQHFLFGEKSGEKGFTVLIVSALQVLGAPDDEAQKAVVLPGLQVKSSPEALSVGGRLFWKNQIEQKTFDHKKLYRLRYATGVSGFVLQFSVSSYSSSMLQQLQNNIESIKFFDPANVKQILETGSHHYIPKAALRRLASTPRADLEALSAGMLSGTTYENPSLGFSYRFPEGWHVSEPVLPSTANGSGQERLEDDPEEASAQCTRVLAYAVRDQNDLHSDAFTPRITLVSADPTCFVPDITTPTSMDDHEAMQLFGGALIRAFSGTPFMGQGATNMRAIDLHGHMFFEIPTAKAVPIKGSSLRRKVHMQFVLTPIRNYWMIWLFESDTESELGRLLKTSISFNSSGAPEGTQ